MASEATCCPNCNNVSSPVQYEQQPGVLLIIYLCPSCCCKWTEAIPYRESRAKQPRLTEDEKRAIAYRYTELQSAIEQGSPDVARKYDALCHVYRDKSHKFLHSFASARDKQRWARQLETWLFAEIEPQFWPTEEHPY